MNATKWRRILDLDRVGVHDRFLELGGTSLQAARFVNEMQAELGESIFVVTLFNAPTVAEYAVLLETQYPAAVSRVVEPAAAVGSRAATRAAITEDDLARFRSLVPTTAAPTTENGPRNPPAVFILSPPRSGTTLLRIMLSGHPDLFAASELQLLGFSTLQERATAYAGRFSGWLDGTVRALMQLEHVGADEAWMRMAAAEGEGLTTKQFFRRLQASAEPRMIVDKSPSYALDPAALRKARADFDGAHYIHLVRHPGAMIDSFERHHMEQVLYLGEHDFTSRQLAELVWTQSHHNILAFLDAVPADRWARVRFEDLVRDPSAQMRSLCTRLELDFHDAVLRPYDDLDDKMVDGVYTDSAPMGDPGFLAHGRIDPAAATVPASTLGPTSLGQPTRELAAGFGYDPGQDRPAPKPLTTWLASIANRPKNVSSSRSRPPAIMKLWRGAYKK
jgi:hypothetical protein